MPIPYSATCFTGSSVYFAELGAPTRVEEVGKIKKQIKYNLEDVLALEDAQ